MVPRRPLGVAVAAALCGLASPATAAEITELGTSYAPGSVMELSTSVGVDWSWRVRRARITKEVSCVAHEAVGGASLCPDGSRILDANELDLSRTTSHLTVDAEVAFGRIFSVGIALPIVLTDSVELRFAPGVDGSNSLVDPHNRPSFFGLPFDSPTRAGLDQLEFRLRGAPLSMARDAADPSWVVEVGLGAPIGAVAQAGNDAAGEGIWSVWIDTAISARVLPWLEPFGSVGATFVVPGGDSLYRNYGVTQTVATPSHKISLRFGTEFIPFERPHKRSAVRIELGGQVDFVFDGRAYSDLFDALGSSACDPRDLDAPCDLTTLTRGDIDPSTGLPRKSDGITVVEHHAVISGWMTVRYEVYEALELVARAHVARETPHFLTFADVGEDLDQRGDVEVNNSRGDNELNPVYNEHWDTPGTRFRTEDTLTLGLDFAIRGRF